MASVSDVAKIVRERGIEFFLCSFVEMSGAPKAKVVPATHLDDMAEEGAGFAGFAAGNMGQGPHSPDMMAIPDLNSLTILPWRKNIAWVAGDIHVEGQAYDTARAPYCVANSIKRASKASNSERESSRNFFCSRKMSAATSRPMTASIRWASPAMICAPSIAISTS